MADMLGALESELAAEGETLRFAGCSTTFVELQRRSRRIAIALQTRGVKPDALVALALPLFDELVSWVLGCWRAGAAFFPTDLSYSAVRVRYMLDDARPELVVTVWSLIGDCECERRHVSDRYHFGLEICPAVHRPRSREISLRVRAAGVGAREALAGC